MSTHLFLVNQLRKNFLSQDVKPFQIFLPQNILNIEDKNRSNLFTWRGQFSPQFVENIMLAYTPKNAIVFDPFIGSGTVLYTSGCLGLKALGCELNPAAWILSRTYQLINLKLDNTILEEFLPQLIYRSLRGIDESFEIGPRNTFSGLSFLSSLGNVGQGGEPSLRTKNQDFILGKKLYLKTAFDSGFQNYKLLESHLGYVCAECKTNLDKTMFQEAVATSRDLKIAVPASLYFLVCEFLDMMPVSIISTQIDDVLIVRKNKRLPANIRQQYKTPESRKRYRQAYAEFLDSSKYYCDVFQRMIDKIQMLIDDTAPEIDKILKRGHF